MRRPAGSAFDTQEAAMGWYDDRVDDDRIPPDPDEREVGGVRAYGLGPWSGPEGYDPEGDRARQESDFARSQGGTARPGVSWYGDRGMGGYGGDQGGYTAGERAGYGGMGGAMGDYYSGGGQAGAGVGAGRFQAGIDAWRGEAFGARGRDDVGEHAGKGPRGYRSEERIRDEVCHLLTQHGRIDASDVEVTVERGEVTLGGTVTDRSQKRLAERIVEGVYGVEDVHNRLRVKPPGRPEARSDEDTLERTRLRTGGGSVRSGAGRVSRQLDNTGDG